MGYEVKWTASAKADTERIIRHIAVTLASPKAASEHLEAFLGVADSISEFPEIRAVGSHPALARRKLRTYFVKSYVVLYSFDGNEAVVHRIFHTLQDYARLIECEADGASTKTES